ncbi:MAG: FoF1 ATP synthase subunit gamma [Verrucomicrobiales bacterium]
MRRLEHQPAQVGAPRNHRGHPGRHRRAQAARDARPPEKDLVADFSIKDPVHFSEAKSVSKFVIDQFRSGEVNRVRVAFTNFVSTLTQKPCVDTLLPVSPIQLGGGPRDWEGMGQGEAEQPKEVPNVGYLFEPSAAAVFEEIVPQYIHYQFYQMVLEARASEHSARMVAMKSATDNAKQMVKDLTLEYNKVRQAAITGELLEITTAMRAME